MKLYGTHFNYDGNRQKGFVVYDKDFNIVYGVVELEAVESKLVLVFRPSPDAPRFTANELGDIVVFMAKHRTEG